jgi:hypothetical protein
MPIETATSTKASTIRPGALALIDFLACYVNNGRINAAIAVNR